MILLITLNNYTLRRGGDSRLRDLEQVNRSTSAVVRNADEHRVERRRDANGKSSVIRRDLTRLTRRSNAVLT